MMQNTETIVHSVDDELQEEQPKRMQFALSTIDNPFNPFDEFNEWFMFDIANEYYCSEYLGRIIEETEEMSELEKILETERAIDEIIELNPNPIYIKVAREIQL